MPGKSPFSQDWRDCLKAHYTHVIRAEDHRTEKTLRAVLHECGYSDADLNEWYLLATMRADDLPPSFAPDVERAVAVAVPPMPAAELPLDEAAPEVETLDEPSDADDAPPHDPDGFQQLSLF